MLNSSEYERLIRMAQNTVAGQVRLAAAVTGPLADSKVAQGSEKNYVSSYSMMQPAQDWAETFRALPAYTADRLARRGLVGLAGSTIRFFQGGGEGVQMWHNMLVEQILLAEKVIRTIAVHAL